MKVYAVIHEEDGEFIGHGLYDTTTSIVSVHATKESAEIKAKECADEYGGTYYVEEQVVN